MILTIDLGNTSLKIGVFDGEEKISFGQYDTKSSTDYVALIKNHLYKNNLKESLLEDVIISSVVPKFNANLSSAIVSLIGKEPIFINPYEDYGMKIDIPNIDELGADLIVMCAYGYHLFKQELLVISMGTATVISHVSADGAFSHCVISPGYCKIAETLWGNAAKLPEFEITKTKTFLANTTIDAMNVGTYQGYIGMVRYLLAGIKGELQCSPKIIACGGFGKEVAPDISEIEYYEADLVTSGLHYIYNTYFKNETNLG